MPDLRLPFTVADALAAGLTRQQLRSPRFRRLFHGVYVEARVADSPALRARAALLCHGPEAIISHTTAAALYSLPVPREAVTHVMVPSGASRSKIRDIVCHSGETADRHMLNGIPVARPLDVFVQSAAILDLVDLVVLGDSIVRARLLTQHDLLHRSRRSRARNARAARRAAGFVRDRVDSPQESRLRILLVLAGMPEPVVNLDIRDESERIVYRIDLSYPTVKVAIEYDGRHHIERVDQWERDLRRREQLEADGWRFVVVTARDLYREPAALVERVHAVLRQRGLNGLTAAPRAEWRSHFAA